MNIRKNIDYSEMYAELDIAMAAERQQMELYWKIGKTVCQRHEKGAAVAAAEYLSERYPDAQGFSPRNLRRMRNLFRTYGNHPNLMQLAMQLGWTQNIVILEADLTMDQREWYLRAAKELGWSKKELLENINLEAYLYIVLDIGQEICDNRENFGEDNAEEGHGTIKGAEEHLFLQFSRRILLRRHWRKMKSGGVSWRTMHFPIFTEKRIAFMRC